MKTIHRRITKRLSAKQRNYLRARLLEKRRQLVRQLEAGLSQTPDQSAEGVGADLLDLAQDSEAFNAAYQLAEIEFHAVAEIENAIQRLDQGTYGICETCGRPIPAVRLKALPSASLCIRCKEAQEKEQEAEAGLPYERIEDVRDAMFDPESVYGSVRGRKVS